MLVRFRERPASGPWAVSGIHKCGMAHLPLALQAGISPLEETNIREWVGWIVSTHTSELRVQPQECQQILPSKSRRRRTFRVRFIRAGDTLHFCENRVDIMPQMTQPSLPNSLPFTRTSKRFWTCVTSTCVSVCRALQTIPRTTLRGISTLHPPTRPGTQTRRETLSAEARF